MPAEDATDAPQARVSSTVLAEGPVPASEGSLHQVMGGGQVI
jgi:hypothetical protein